MTYPSIWHYYPDGYAALYPSYETGSHRNNPFSIEDINTHATPGRLKERSDVLVNSALLPRRVRCALAVLRNREQP